MRILLYAAVWPVCILPSVYILQTPCPQCTVCCLHTDTAPIIGQPLRETWAREGTLYRILSKFLIPPPWRGHRAIKVKKFSLPYGIILNSIKPQGAHTSSVSVYVLIIHMKKLLDSDWLRTVQFSLKQCRKEVIGCKKGNKANILIGQWTKKFTVPIKSFVFKSKAHPGWHNYGAIFSSLRDN